MFGLQENLTHSTNFFDKYLRTAAGLAAVKDCGKNEKSPKGRIKKRRLNPLIFNGQRVVNFFVQFVADFFDEQIGFLDVVFQR
jgi:hypothetical protein